VEKLDLATAAGYMATYVTPLAVLLRMPGIDVHMAPR